MMDKFSKLLVFIITAATVITFTSCNKSYSSEYRAYEMDTLSGGETLPASGILSSEEYDFVDISGLVSEKAIIYDMTHKKIIAFKNAFDRCAPASLTKIVTAITALDRIEDFYETVTIDESMFEYIVEQNASVAGFEKDETVTVKDLLYGVLLPSGADAAIALAEYLAGSEANFAELMNEKVSSIGCQNTHFVNVTGLDADGQYTSAYDMCVIFEEACKYDKFIEIASSSEYYMPATDMHPSGMKMNSSVFSGFSKNSLSTEYIIAGKTGYTDNAGLCLAALSNKNNTDYITVTLKAGDGSSRPAYNFFDYDTIFNEYI